VTIDARRLGLAITFRSDKGDWKTRKVMDGGQSAVHSEIWSDFLPISADADRTVPVRFHVAQALTILSENAHCICAAFAPPH